MDESPRHNQISSHVDVVASSLSDVLVGNFMAPLTWHIGLVITVSRKNTAICKGRDCLIHRERSKCLQEQTYFEFLNIYTVHVHTLRHR